MQRLSLPWVILAGIVLVAFGYVAVKTRSDHRQSILFVLPDNFTGKIYVIESTTAVQKVRFKDGKATIIFDGTNKMYLQSLDPFNNWLEYKWEYIDGKALAYGPAPVPEGQVGVFDLAAGGTFGNGPRVIEFYIGTPEQFKKLRPGFTPPPL